MEEQQIEDGVTRRQHLRDRNVREVVLLLERRTELRGIHPRVDLVADNLGWMV